MKSTASSGTRGSGRVTLVVAPVAQKIGCNAGSRNFWDLLRLAELEMIERERRTVERRIKEARFPAVKSLDSFEFTALPSLNKTLVLELARS